MILNLFFGIEEEKDKEKKGLRILGLGEQDEKEKIL